MPGGNLSQTFHLFRGDHAGRDAEPEDTEVGVAFCDDPALGIEVLVDRLASTWHSTLDVLVVRVDRPC